MPNSHIIGTGSSIPKRVLSNSDLETIVDTSDEWISRRSGIKERRISSKKEKESAADLATRASLKAIEMANVSPESLDLIVVGTVTPDRQFPSSACMVQKELNAANAAAFDISAGCSGFLYALSVVDNAISAGTCKTSFLQGIISGVRGISVSTQSCSASSLNTRALFWIVSGNLSGPAELITSLRHSMRNTGG